MDASWGCGHREARLGWTLTRLAANRCWLEAQLVCQAEHLHVAPLLWWAQGTWTSYSSQRELCGFFSSSLRSHLVSPDFSCIPLITRVSRWGQLRFKGCGLHLLMGEWRDPIEEEHMRWERFLQPFLINAICHTARAKPFFLLSLNS